MTSTPLQLAALVSAGVPGLYPVAALPSTDDVNDFDSAVIIDSADKRWRVRSPKNPAASVRLEAEHVILQSFTPGLRARLPFLVPTVVGTVPLQGKQVFIYSHIPGDPVSIETLAALAAAGPEGQESLAQKLAQNIATIHVFPTEMVEDAYLPTYSSQEVRQRRVAELEVARKSGKVPPALLVRWDKQLADQELWTFRPRVIHGDLNEDNLVLDGRNVVEITGWSEVCVGDPAQDFAWLFASPDADFRKQIFAGYRAQMPQEPDQHLETRAKLYAEFALIQWLVRGLELEDLEMVTEALELLQNLEEDLRALGELF